MYHKQQQRQQQHHLGAKSVEFLLDILVMVLLFVNHVKYSLNDM
jgi:hypothetical protein